MPTEREIIADVLNVGRKLGKRHGDALSRSEYLQNGTFSRYQLYDGGREWSYYCHKAGFTTKAKKTLSDQEYLDRLARAHRELGRDPKFSERKKFGLKFKTRWPAFGEFLQFARSRGVTSPSYKPRQDKQIAQSESSAPSVRVSQTNDTASRPIPPIPKESSREKWKRIDVAGFPFEPHDESGVVALLAILCSKKTIPWQIVELSGGKGIDAVCYDESKGCHLRVELKFILSRSSWNHPFESFDYLVCWENRWRGQQFPKPVLGLKDILRKGHTPDTF